MAATVSGASLSGIYDRLHDAPEYNPMTAETFADWSTEAGDVVTMQRGAESYEVPLHSTNLVWRGTPQMSLSATGNKERDPLSKVSKQKYGGGSGAKRNDEEETRYLHYLEETDSYWRNYYGDQLTGLYSYVEQTSSYWRAELGDTANGLHSEIMQTSSYWRASLDDATNSLHSEIVQTSSYWRAELDDTANGLHSEIVQTSSYWRSELEDTSNELHSEIVQTASYWRLALDDTSNSLHSEIVTTAASIRQEVSDGDNSLRGSITTESNRISLVVEGTGSNATIKSAQIISSINNDSSSILISANKISLSGTTTINDVMTVGSHTIYLSLPTRIQGDVMAESLTLRGGSGGTSIGETDLSGMIKKATVNATGDVLTLTPVSGNDITFNKAVSLSGTWNGTRYEVSATSGTISGNPPNTSVALTVEGYPNPNQTVYAKVYENGQGYGPALDQVEMTLAENVSSKTVTLKANTFTKGSISTQATYDSGWNAGYDTAYGYVSWPSAAPTGQEVTSFVVNAPLADRSGSAAHTFRLTKGSPSSSGGYAAVSYGGVSVARIDISNWYTAGYNDANPSSGTAGGRSGSSYNWDFSITRGNGTTKTLTIDCSAIYSDARSGYTQGIFTPTTLYNAGTVTVHDRGTGVTARQVLSANGTVYYKALQSQQYYNAGTTTKTARGDSVTAREVLSSGGTVYYQAVASQLYYNAGTTTKTARGDSVTARPVLSTGGTEFYTAGTAKTYYNAGTTTKTDRGDSVTAREVLSSGGTVYYQAVASQLYYNAGTSTVTARGDSITARPVLSSGGTLFYTAGTETTVYPGNGSTVIGRGSSVSVTVQGTVRYFKYHASTETPTSAWYTMHTSKPTGTVVTVYLPGTEKTYYQGNGSTVTGRGTGYSVTPIGSTSVRLDSAGTYYKGNGGDFTVQGSAVAVSSIDATTLIRLGSSGTYYKGNGGSFTVQGSSAGSITPIGTTSVRLDSAGTYYKGNGGDFTVQGSAVAVSSIDASTLIRLGSSGTYYKGNGGDFTVQGSATAVSSIDATSLIRLGDATTMYPGDGGEYTVQGTEQAAYLKTS